MMLLMVVTVVYEDVGGLGTAQRNTAAGVIIARKTSATTRMYWSW